MTLNAALLESSFQLVAERQPQFITHFYDLLFERYPQAKALFGRNSRDTQEKMLTDALASALDHIEDVPWLETNLTELGRKHQLYAVTPDMFDWVGECLLTTLQEVAGDDWNDNLQQAWSDAYTAIVGLMLKGYDA